MILLMVALISKLKLFKDYGGSKLEVKLEGEIWDWEELDMDSKKEHKKAQLSLSDMNHLQFLYNI